MRKLSRDSLPLHNIQITVLPTLYCKESLRMQAENIIGDYQGGFHPNRSATNQVFTLRMILSKYYETSKSIHQVFLDFRQAYQ